METDLFDFDIPERLIAQHPAARRGDSRLMKVDRAAGAISHHRFCDIGDLLPAGSLLVFNNARVRKARLYGRLRRDGRACEFLFLENTAKDGWQALAKPLKKIKTDDLVVFPGERIGRVARREGDSVFIAFKTDIDEDYFERHGLMPLPPYIRRAAGAEDAERYQTVYAKENGSAAAPTAGLHFTSGLRQELAARGFEQTEITLHVGIGTFLPIRTAAIEDHLMHEETFSIGPESAVAVNRARAAGRPVVAVGTTSVRALEAAAGGDGCVIPGTAATSLYITPGFRFAAVSHLVTNFHTPRSTLLVLVSAFAGYDLIKRAYEEAVQEGYRFFSYGDAMLII